MQSDADQLIIHTGNPLDPPPPPPAAEPRILLGCVVVKKICGRLTAELRIMRGLCHGSYTGPTVNPILGMFSLLLLRCFYVHCPAIVNFSI